jgi:hypothetical protein
MTTPTRKRDGSRSRAKRAADIVALEDLAPRKDVTGGRGTVVFGERVDETGAEDAALPKKRRKRT